LLEKHFKGELSYYECELRMRHKNGSWVWILDRGKVATWTKEGQPLLMFGMHQDITERQQMEHELKTQRDFATQIINLMGQGLTVTNAEGLFEFVNPAYARLFGYKTADLIGKSPRDITAPESRAALVEQRKLRLAGNTTTYESLLRRVDGSTAPVLITAVPRGSSEHYEGAIAVITDLTEQKQAEDRIIALLHEKEALLKELQHRVKNSFTVITSIIDLMENASQSHEAREALFEVRNRIQAMGTLYDLLYKTDTIIATSLDVYCARVIGSLPLPPHIQVTQSYDPITVPMKTAGPVGLILTELITNVTKYAFPDGRDGKVSVSLQKMDRWVILQVEDDGIGMPAEFDLSQATSLGLTLVQVLADQIQGSFRIERVNGTRCIVEFPG